jgi:hypothetical protein
MCGEVFSDKFSPAIKARVDQPHPLARPGRWSAVHTPSADVLEHDTAFFDYEGASQTARSPAHYSRNGWATEAEAKAALDYHVKYSSIERSDYAIIPPAQAFGDHDASRLDHDQLVALGNAILNNDQKTYEALRQEYADVTRAPKAPPAPPKKTPTELVAEASPTRRQAADALVWFLTDHTGDGGNPGSFIDTDDEDGHDESFEISNWAPLHGREWPVSGLPDEHYGALDYLRDLVRAYRSADE